MGTQRAHILLPQDLLKDIDELVGPRGRSSFLVEVARAEVRRQKLLRLLESKEPFWDDKNHPELSAGADVWVNKLRKESDERIGDHGKPASAARSRKPSKVG